MQTGSEELKPPKCVFSGNAATLCSRGREPPVGYGCEARAPNGATQFLRLRNDSAAPPGLKR